jgi:prephenate dehydratase
VGEVLLPISHCLVALPGVTKAEVRRVMSHPQALAQCDTYLRNLTGVVRESVYDTAGAARDIARHSLRCAFPCERLIALTRTFPTRVRFHFRTCASPSLRARAFLSARALSLL